MITSSQMKQIIKTYSAKILSIGGAFPTTMTDSNKLQSLMQKLYPLSCDKELIRFGPQGDGGYLIPNDIAGIEACFSPGVSVVSGFEKDCADLGMKVFLADKSVEQPAESHHLFNFTKKFIGVTTNDDFMTLDNWVAQSAPESRSDLLLQIDIEGYEYEVFLSITDCIMRRFRIIVAEFHHIDQFWSKPFFSLAERAFEKILQTHSCVHIHPNNNLGRLKKGGLDIPRILEFTFLRNDRIVTSAYQSVFPNPLDCDNTTNPAITLPKCWHGGK